MEIDLRVLYASESLDIDEDFSIPEEYYQNTDIIRMSLVKAKGRIYINHEEDIALDVNIKGTFILPCAVTLEEVSYDFDTKVEEIVSQNLKNDEIKLALLDILWENIVLEVPMKVVKKGIKADNLKGEGWELETNNN